MLYSFTSGFKINDDIPSKINLLNLSRNVGREFTSKYYNWSNNLMYGHIYWFTSL